MPPTKLFLLSSLMLAGALLPAHADVLVTVNKSDQRMTVSVDGVQRYSWPVSTGGSGYDTPGGTFRPNRMDADHVSKEYDNAPMPHAIFFDDHGHAIHGSYEKVGRPVSHGCVRVSAAHAAELFSLVQLKGMGKTKVEIGGDAPIITARLRQTAHRRQSVSPDDRTAYAPQTGSYPSSESYDYSRPPQRYPGRETYGYDQGDGYSSGYSDGYAYGRAPAYSDDSYTYGYR